MKTFQTTIEEEIRDILITLQAKYTTAQADEKLLQITIKAIKHLLIQ